MGSEVYVDIHSHIIPGVDDGSKSLDQSMKMVAQAYEEGIRLMIATTHYGLINADFDKSAAIDKFRELKSRAKELYPDMRFIMGNEIYYVPGIVDVVRRGDAMTLGGTSYVLVEFSPFSEYRAIFCAVQEFMLAGYRPILAHIERYDCLRGDIEKVNNLIEGGAYIQVNATSLVRANGRKKLFGGNKSSQEDQVEWCYKLLKENMIHFIATDCHNDDTRRPYFKDAVAMIERISGQAMVKRITVDNIIHLLKDEEI